ncbi:MAG: PSD1 domain-containing protein [Planctomycetaceae bacterium]|nr:PSD1 domain-containing protein [Planctomycetaceae bacterium]
MISNYLNRTNHRELRPACFLFLVWLFVVGLPVLPPRTATAQDDRPIDFNREIRPILSENCFYCHGQDANHRAADLRLDVAEAAFSFGAIVPHDPEASPLIERILDTDPETQMPPPSSNRSLSSEQKELLRRWIAQGAPYQQHWAFIPPARTELPIVDDSAWNQNPIDRFVWSLATKNGLRVSPPADKEMLIKRLYSDLIGLPPTPAEVSQFVADPDPTAYEKLVDRLLANPHYGERMALPWLDAARYADSNGFQQDGDTWQWIWRDWVVRALNQDLPFDQFSIWQLAGDLLPDATEDQKIASAFNRNHLLNGEGGAIPEEQRFVVLFDRIDTTSTNWLGLTMACAQCHDHKYDPLTMKDYYSLMDAFNRVDEQGVPRFFSSRIRVDTPFIELPTDENRARIADYENKLQAARDQVAALTAAAFVGWRDGFLAHPVAKGNDQWPEEMEQLLLVPRPDRSSEQQQKLDQLLRQYFDSHVLATLKSQLPAYAELDRWQNELNQYRADQIPRVMIMSDANPRVTHVLDRGQYLAPMDAVSFDTPKFLPPLPPDFPRNRLGFAKWLFLPEHPLTARVQVNRLWQQFFGEGLVTTPEDLGVQSEYPLHKDLLDWLAVEYREQQWSTKSLVRLMVTSQTYRQSSVVTPDAWERDPRNDYWTRARRMRMPSLVLRDWALAAAGLLDNRIGGVPVYPYQPDGVWESLAITKERDFTYPKSSGADLYRRSLYTFWRRTVGPANMFDAANRQSCRVRTSITSTPLHALTMLNDPTWIEAARMLAVRTMREPATNLDELLCNVFRRVLCREPHDAELHRLRLAYDKQLAFYQANPTAAQEWLSVGQSAVDSNFDVVAMAALGNVCLAILNLDEAMTRQ